LEKKGVGKRFIKRIERLRIGKKKVRKAGTHEELGKYLRETSVGRRRTQKILKRGFKHVQGKRETNLSKPPKKEGF